MGTIYFHFLNGFAAYVSDIMNMNITDDNI